MSPLIAAFVMGTALAARPAMTVPAASAGDIPVLADLLVRARWEPTPELSGAFLAGRIFEAVPDGSHRLVATDCVATEPVLSTYTSTELIAQLQTGVRVDLKGISLGGGSRLVKKVRFGTPSQASIPSLELSLSKSCQARLRAVSPDSLGRMYIVQETLLATISEQTCGVVDGRGRIVGLGEAGAEYSQACSQQSFEPVAVGYRTVPLQGLLPADLAQQVAAVAAVAPVAPIEIAEDAAPVAPTVAAPVPAEAKVREPRPERPARMEPETASKAVDRRHDYLDGGFYVGPAIGLRGTVFPGSQRRLGLGLRAGATVVINYGVIGETAVEAELRRSADAWLAVLLSGSFGFWQNTAGGLGADLMAVYDPKSAFRLDAGFGYMASFDGQTGLVPRLQAGWMW